MVVLERGRGSDMDLIHWGKTGQLMFIHMSLIVYSGSDDSPYRPASAIVTVFCTV